MGKSGNFVSPEKWEPCLCLITVWIAVVTKRGCWVCLLFTDAGGGAVLDAALVAAPALHVRAGLREAARLQS